MSILGVLKSKINPYDEGPQLNITISSSYFPFYYYEAGNHSHLAEILINFKILNWEKLIVHYSLTKYMITVFMRQDTFHLSFSFASSVSHCLLIFWYITREYYELAVIWKEIQYFSDVYRKYLDTVNLHAAWLNASEIQSGMVKNIVSSYNAILKEMKDALISSTIKYDFRPMAVAMLFLCQVS